jgi:hypothetical protein
MERQKRLLILLLCFCLTALTAQNHIGVNLRLDVGKTWKFNKKIRLELSQQVQVNPEFSRDQKKFGDIFNEINLFPDNDSDGDGKDDGEDDDNDSNTGNQPSGLLNDSPYTILWEWRTATDIRMAYKLAKWLRFIPVYTFNVRKGNDIRHSVQTNMEVIEKLSDAFEFTQRIGFQYTSRKNKKTNETIWEEDFVARTGFEWDISKKYTLETNVGVNGKFDKSVWSWDRLRVDTSLEYRVTDVQSFEFGYRFQRTLDTKAQVSHGVNMSLSWAF